MRWLFLVAVVVLLWLLLSSSQGDGGGDSTPGPGPSGEPDDAGSDAANYGTAGDVAQAWARIEGFFQPGTPAQRYNDPVNLHGEWPGVVGHSPSGIAIFDSIADGWNAAAAYIRQQAAAHPGWSFLNFFGKVLGNLQGQPVNNEQGNSTAEAQYVAGQLGVDPNTFLSQYVG
jgi:hypothetical protein